LQAFGLVFATTLVGLVPTVPAKVGAALTGLASFGVVLMAFEPDHPQSVKRSWHDAIHDGVYPVIPVASLAAAVALAWGLRGRSCWRVPAHVSASVFIVALAAVGLTAIDAIAQLARYLLFASLLVWLETRSGWQRTMTADD
jgi:hypothetical protein